MSTDKGTASEPAAASPDAVDEASDGGGPDWWHREHPIFYALSGFFTGLVTVIVVPGAFAGVLAALFSYERAEDYFPFVLVVFAIPFGLIATSRTRRFGRYMLLGMLLTAVVVVGVAALVLWMLYRSDS